jgi:predicted cation transporter
MAGLPIVELGLLAIFAAVLVGPLVVKRVERNLELFLFVMGVAAVTISGAWTLTLVHEAVSAPLMTGIAPAVLFAGLLFHYGKRQITHAVRAVHTRIPIRVVVFAIISLLGLLSSVITAVISSLVLVEMISLLHISQSARRKIAVFGCFAIGLGAVLTPVGEPLSAIVTSALAGPPYNAGFPFLFNLLAPYVIPGILAFSAAGAFFAKWKHHEAGEVTPKQSGTGASKALIRAVKVYVFVSALILLGGGFRVLVENYIMGLPPQWLFWANSSSAILDNATLAAAEISPFLQLAQIKSALLGLLLAGGMLIPGNIPNIICADMLDIPASRWARIGIPAGLIAMAVYFAWLFL